MNFEAGQFLLSAPSSHDSVSLLRDKAIDTQVEHLQVVLRRPDAKLPLRVRLRIDYLEELHPIPPVLNQAAVGHHCQGRALVRNDVFVQMLFEGQIILRQ